MSGPAIDLSHKISPYSLIGLAFLWASAYFVPPLTPKGVYFLSVPELLALIIPTVLTVVTVSLFFYAVCAAAQRFCSPHVATGGAVVAISLLTLIGLKSVMYVAGYGWHNQISRGYDDPLSAQRFVKIAAFFIVLAILWGMRGALFKWGRVLSSLGLSFGALAAIRLVILLTMSGSPAASSPSSVGLAIQPMKTSLSGAASENESAHPLSSDTKSRRVVWLIFDETDFNRVYAAPGAQQLNLPNFQGIARKSVFATNANSPANATLYSIPALLMGMPVGGNGVRIVNSGLLSLEGPDRQLVPFDEATSIFGALSAEGRGASVLGFYHPYCKLFRLQRCDSFTFPEPGGWDSALLANVPDFIASKIRSADNWDAITRDSLRLLPEYLMRDDSLTFVHLNVPHLPAFYADALNHETPSSNPLTEYSRNLMLADRILGDIIEDLSKQVSSHEILLVVSTDHWLRNGWYRPSVQDTSQPVPLIMWMVGETSGFVLNQPLSTVHTAAMILDYLHGNLRSQADIAKWWSTKPFYPSYIAPSS